MKSDKKIIRLVFAVFILFFAANVSQKVQAEGETCYGSDDCPAGYECQSDGFSGSGTCVIKSQEDKLRDCMAGYYQSGVECYPQASEGDPCDPSINNYCKDGLACVTADMEETYYYCADASGSSSSSSDKNKASYQVLGSQCKTGQESGSQTGCSHNSDQQILDGQCAAEYGKINCQSMSEYLNTMQMQCEAENPAGIDCKTISQGGYYGREAAKFAQYLQNKSKNNDASKGGFPTDSGKDNGGVKPIGKVEIPGAEIGLPAPPGGIQQILKNLLVWLLGIVGVIALIGFVISGIQYIVASGSEDQMETAKRNMLYSIIGITVVLASFVIVQAINYALEARSLF